MDYNTYDSQNRFEEEIKAESQSVLAEISENKAKLEEIKKEWGITGKEDISYLKSAAQSGNIAAQYYYAMALKVPGTAAGAGFDYESANYLRNAANNGFPLASSQYGLMLMNENNTSEGLNYVIEGANYGDHDAIYSLATTYNSFADQQSDKSEREKYLKAAAIWYRIGLYSGVEKICIRSDNYDRILRNLKSGSSYKAPKKAAAAVKSSGSSGPKFDKKIIIIILLIIFIIIFLLLGIFIGIPLIQKLLGNDNNNSGSNASPNPENSENEISIIAPDANSGDIEINLEDQEFTYYVDENGNIVIIGPSGNAEVEIPETESEAESEIEDVPIIKEYIIDADGGLHLRAEPSTSAESLLIIPNGSLITVEFIEDGWAKTFYNGLEGWCKADYILLPNEDDVIVDAEKFIADMFVIAKSGLRLRTEPNLNAETITLMTYGSSVYVYKMRTDEWYFVQYFDADFNLYEGWCSSEYLDYTKPTTSTSTNEENWDNYIVDLYVDNEDGATLYADHDTSSTIITTLPYGSVVYVYEFGNYADHNNMNRVSFSFKGNTYYGWTNANLDISCPVAVYEVSTAGGTYLYSSPTTKSAKLLPLVKGLRVVLINEADSEVLDPDTSEYWWKVKYIGTEGEYIGWCLDTNLEYCFGSFNE